MVMHILHHDQGDMQAMTWAEGTFSTILGAFVLILTGRGPRADGQTANGLPPVAQAGGPAPTLTPAIPVAGVPGTPGTQAKAQ